MDRRNQVVLRMSAVIQREWLTYLYILLLCASLAFEIRSMLGLEELQNACK